MSEPLHVLVIPLWYPRSEQDVDGIFFQNQAQALQRKGIKTAILAPCSVICGKKQQAS
ncbi:hypothetical protein ACNWB0_000103 [Neisseria gonorrhoeae]